MKAIEDLALAGFVAASREFQAKLVRLKTENPLVPHGWYPYDSLTAVSVLERLLAMDYPLLPPLIASEPVLDAGCADGDLAFFLESLGADVDAVDYSEMNFNQLEGARRLRELLASRVNVYTINLDWYFELPRKAYGLIVFLGTLYHLKNPFYVLERLAQCGAWCLLSTRVARMTGRGTPVRDEPIAYLLDPREANDDSTNYWIFSEAGLSRLVERAGWSVVSRVSAGCIERSNPVDPDADERMFLLLKSRVRYPDVHVRLLEGWHAVEHDGWRWTENTFAFEVMLPRQRAVKEFALVLAIPDAVAPLELACEVDGQPCGSVMYQSPGSYTFRGVFPKGRAERAEVRFRVIHASQAPAGDSRELGVRVCFTGPEGALPLRLS